MNILRAIENRVGNSPARRLILDAAFEQKSRLVSVLFLGLISAILEGVTFALLAVALEVLANSSSQVIENLAPWGFAWIGALRPGLQFLVLVVLAVACQILKSFSQIAGTQLTTILSAQAAQSVQQKVLTRILDMNYGESGRYRMGELTAFVVQPAESVANTLILGIGWVTGLMTTGAYIAVLCTISWPLLLVSLALFGTVVWLQRKVGAKIGSLSQQLALEQADLSRKVVEGVGALRLLHAFHKQEYFKIQVTELQNRYIHTMWRLNTRLSLLGPLGESILLAGLGAFLLLGYYQFRGDRANLLPDLLTFIAVLNRLSGRVSQLGYGYSQTHQYANRVNILNPIMADHRQVTVRKSGGAIFTGLSQGIRLVDLGLRYPGREEWALRGINLEMKVGESLALVGTSGSGKSSLADLLLGLYEPTEGKILVDGRDLSDWDLGSWRSRIGVVSQDTMLFNASVRDNILFAKPDATEEELREALRGANAWDFVSAMPKGLDTVVGERGFMLSGGQRQRLAIARALLRQPSLLILDEATSALDSQSERLVQETIDNLPLTGIRIVIAHRLSTICNSEKILVLENGKKEEIGSHNYLMEKRGRYFGLWKMQASAAD